MLDPLQFAYLPKVGVEDGIIFLLYLDSAFNSIWLALLGGSLTAMRVDFPVVSWIMDYLTGRPPYVRLHG